MKMKQFLFYGAGSAALFVSGVAIGQQVNIDSRIHPHLAAAQQQIGAAEGHIDQAQASWGDKLGGHAVRAKALLQQADGELKQAAQYANKYK